MEDQKTEVTDIFLWANQIDSMKNELNVELFLVNKLYTPFSMRFSKDLEQQVRALFLLDIVANVNFGAGIGMSVRDYEMSEAEDNVVLRTEKDKVEKASKVIGMIEKQRSEITEFSEEEHEFKKMKAIVARFTKKESSAAPFYIVKAIQQSNALKGTLSWEINGGSFDRFKADVGLKIPSDNQVLIVDNDIFIFNQAKFEKLFDYEYKKQLLADQKVAEIASQYKLSFPDGVDLQSLVKEKKKVVKKLQKLEIGTIKQEQALEYADEMQLELMTDDAGAIIIMDSNDLDMFVSLINEDFITSELTGKRYEITGKKLLDEPAGEPPRG